MPQESTLIDMTRTARSDETRRHDLVLTFDELALIYKSLQAVKTLSLGMPRESRRWRSVQQVRVTTLHD
jgi:hypothetical protein